MPEERELKHTPHMVRNPYPSSDQPRLCHPTVQNPSPSLPSNHFQKKKKKKNQTPNCEERAESVRSRTQPQITPNPKSHRSRRTPAWARSHPSTCQIAPPEALVRSRSLKHHWDCTPALARSHPWPTHTWSLSFSIYLSLSLNCRSLSSSLSLFIWPNFWVQWLFCFDFCFI